MASLQFLYHQFGEAERDSLAPQLGMLLEFHYIEKIIPRPKKHEDEQKTKKEEVAVSIENKPVAPVEKRENPAAVSAAAVPTPTPEAPVSSSPVAPSPKQKSDNKPQRVSSATTRRPTSRPSSGRRVGGTVPASPYVARASSAMGRSRPSSAPLSPEGRSAARPSSGSRGRPPQMAGGNGTFVERWMEKLYSRNPSPVVVNRKQPAAEHQSKPVASAATPTERASTFTAGDFDVNNKKQPAAAAQDNKPAASPATNENVINTQVFKLPPRPQSSSRKAASIRSEIARNQAMQEEAERQGVPTGIYHQLLSPQVQAHVGRLNQHFAMRNPQPLVANNSSLGGSRGRY